VQPVSLFAFEVTAPHAVLALEVANDGLDRLLALKQSSLLRGDPLGLAPV